MHFYDFGVTFISMGSIWDEYGVTFTSHWGYFGSVRVTFAGFGVSCVDLGSL